MGVPLPMILTGPDFVSDKNHATFTFMADLPDAVLMCSIDGVNDLRFPTAQWGMCESPKTYTYLETGDHKFEVQAMAPDGTVDETKLPALWEWEVALPVDVNAPETQIVKGPPLLYANEIALFEFTGIDDQTLDTELEFECLLDGVLLGSCDSVLSTPTAPGLPYEVEVEFMQFGKHTFEVRAMDEMGNMDSTPAKYTWTYVDILAPDTEIDLGPEEETEATIATFTFLGEEENGTMVFDFECSLDGADFTYCTSPHEIEGLTVGPHVFEVRAMDLSGRVDTTPDLYEWLVMPPFDGVPPDTIIAHHPGPVSGPDVLFGFQANEIVEEFECAVDGEEWQGCEGVLELEGLLSGQHTVQVRAMDLVGHVDPTPASHTWLVQGEPETEITDGPPAISGQMTATFTFESDQPDATFFCSLNGSPFVGCSSPWQAGGLIMNETNSFEVYAANNWRYLDGTRVQDTTPAEYEWEVQDAEPPNTQILSVEHLDWTDLIEPNSIRFELRGSDNGTIWFELEFECQLDNGPWEGCDAPFHYLPVEEIPGGAHVFRVRAVDMFENRDPSPAEYRWNSDDMPETTIVSGPPAQTEATSATFRFSADPADGATFECLLDGGTGDPFVACPAPAANGDVTFANVPYGTHELQVRARSENGVIDLEPAVHEWESGDMTPPVVTITNGPPAITTDMTATFTWTVDDPAASTQCSLDGAQPTFCESGISYTEAQLALATGTAGGPHTLEVIPVKQFLIVEAVGTEWAWEVDDQVAPDTLLEETPPARIGVDLPSIFTFSSPEIASRFECAWDPVGTPVWEGCAGAAPDNTVEFAGLLPGVHTLLVRAVDPSENADPTPASFTWEVVGPATTTIHTGPPREPLANTRETSAQFTFSANQAGVAFGCSLDGADPVPCTSPYTVHGLLPGGHSLEVTSTNSFLLVEQPDGPTNPWEWTIDEPDPNTPQGTNVVVSIPTAVGNARVTFASVAAEGHTSVTMLESPPSELPQGFLLAGAAYWDIQTTAQVTGNVRVCVPYNAATVAEPVSLLHYDELVGAWVDISDQTTGNVVCGDSASLSPFATATRSALALLDTFIDIKPPTQTVNPIATFSFSSNDGEASFECSLDGVPFNSCALTTEYTDLLVGQHELFVRAKNGLGEVDLTPAVHRWTIGPLPDTAIISGPEEATEDRSATFQFTSNVSGALFECALDEMAENLLFLPCGSTHTFTNLAFGDHELLVRAKDNAGNVDPEPAEYSWEIGGIPPLVHDRVRARHRVRVARRHVHVLRRHDRAHLPLLARRRRAFALPVAAHVLRPPARPAHVRGAGLRERGVRDLRGARHDVRVVGRVHDAAEHEHHLRAAARQRRHGSGGRRGHVHVRLLVQQDAGALRVRARRRGVERVRVARGVLEHRRSATTSSASAPSTCRFRRTTTRRPRRTPSASSRRPRRRSSPARRARSTGRPRTSSSPRPSRARPSSARSTSARSSPARTRTRSPTSPTASTCSRSARRPTALSTSARRSGRGRSTASCPRRRSSPARRRRPRAPAPCSRSPRPSWWSTSARSTAACSRAARPASRRCPSRRTSPSSSRSASTPCASALSTRAASSIPRRRAGRGRSCCRPT